MEKKRVNNTKFKEFLKKNGYYFIMALCLLAVAAMITVTVLSKKSDKIDLGPDDPIVEQPNNNEEPVITDPDPDPVVPVDTPIVFASPVSSVNIIKDVYMDSLVWNSTLKQYEWHPGIDFAGKEGDKVYAAYSGKITGVSFDPLHGHVITISHSDKLQTKYCSLSSVAVTQGQTVQKGDVIGGMGNSATREYSLGNRLYFEVIENGKKINPYTYLAIGDK